MIDYWDIFAGASLAIIGVYNVWLSRSSYFETNPFTTLLSRWLRGVGRARTQDTGRRWVVHIIWDNQHNHRRGGSTLIAERLYSPSCLEEVFSETGRG